MKTNEAAGYLENLAKILRLYPDMELLEALNHMYRVLKDDASSNRPKRDKAETTIQINDQLIESLHGMSSDALEHHLRTSGYGRKTLVALAGKLGMSPSQRQSTDALLNMIVKFLEGRRMDSLIRSQRTTTTQTGIESNAGVEDTQAKYERVTKPR